MTIFNKGFFQQDYFQHDYFQQDYFQHDYFQQDYFNKIVMKTSQPVKECVARNWLFVAVDAADKDPG